MPEKHYIFITFAKIYILYKIIFQDFKFQDFKIILNQ